VGGGGKPEASGSGGHRSRMVGTELNGGCPRRVVGDGVKWWVVGGKGMWCMLKLNGGGWRQVVDAEAKWWSAEGNAGWRGEVVGGGHEL